MTTISLADGGERGGGPRVLARRAAGGGFTAIPRWTSIRCPASAARGGDPRRPGGGAAAAGGRAGRAAQLGAAGRARQGARRAVRRGRGRDRLCRRAGCPAVPLPCLLATGPGSWRALLLDAHRTEWELLSHQDFPRRRTAGELGLTGPSFETVFDSAGRRRRAGAGHRAVGGDLAAARPAGAAAAVPDRRAGRGRRGPDRRLSPHRADADRRRSGGRARAAEPC